MNISRLEENTQAPYLLTKDGVLGEQWSHHIEDKRVVFHPINKNGRQLSNQPIKVHEDEILIKHINLDLVNQKAKDFLEFQEFKYIAFDLSSILYKKLGGFYLSSYSEPFENEFKEMNLKLVHLENLDKYVLVDSFLPKKSIQIKSLREDVKHIIGSKGSNIDRIKTKNGLDFIKVIEVSNEEYELILNKFESTIKFLFNYLNMQ